VKCPRCQHENRSGAKFCEECACPLAPTCSNCGNRLSTTAKFCPECAHPVAEPAPEGRFGLPASYTPKHLAEKILTSRTALEGERKQVTVLFVDISGFTSLSERLDVEEVHQLMSRAFDLMLAEVHRYEGTVNQFLGDGIMALFGAPIAHEDHARRAVHAALGIDRVLRAYQQELAPRRIGFRARQGLNTGLVVVGSIGSDLRMDYTAVGDTTNVAARLQQVGEPGKVTISESTHRLVRGYFDTRPLGALHLKGKAEPVAAWEVVAAHETRTRLEVEADRGLTPFVGREHELGQLLDAFERARSGQGQVTLIVGEAGIGKSRLLHELRRRVGGEADWREGHCLSFGRVMAFHPLVDLVRRQFAVGDTDGDAAIAAKIEQGLLDVGAEVASCAPYLRALLSVDPGDVDVKAMSPAQRRGETFEALRRMLVRAAEQRPQVLVIEDLHWIDSASEEFLALLVDTVPALRALLVFTYRPGYSHSFSERSYVTRVVPAALSTEDSTRMVAAVLAAAAVPEELHRLITRKAEGNPFYLEELVKSLEESGALRRQGSRYELTRALGEIVIPGTIQDVIAARIDRLAEAPKRTLQLAAVIGREFTRRLVDRLAEVRERTEGFLRELTALELILERHLYPELAYMFKHALTQDVAYASLLVQRRRELHGLVGLAIEELYADRLPEHYEMLAHHFSRAEEWERALAYLLKAAEKATQAFGFRQALELYGNALDAIRNLGDRVPVATLTAVHRGRAELFFGVGDFSQSREAAEELMSLSRRIEDRPLEAAALVQLATASQWLEDFPSSLQQAQEAIETAEAVGARGALAGAVYVRAYVHAVSGNLDIADSGFTHAIEIAREHGDRSQEALALHMLGTQRAWQGQYRESLELSRAGTRLGRDGRLVVPLLRNLWTEGMSLTDVGSYDGALAALMEGLSLAEKVGDQAYISRLLNTIGWLRIECGDLIRGIELSEASYEVTAKSSRAGHGTGAERRAFIRNNEGEAMMARGELAAAAEALGETHHIVQHPPPSRWMTWRYTSQCYAGLAQLALLQGDPERARRLADQSLEVAVPTRSRKFESWAWRLKGESATLRRAWGEAEEALGRALRIAEAIGQPRHTWLGHVAMGRLDAARGRRDDARRRYRTAWDIIAGLRARTQESTFRAGLEASPLVREVGELVRLER
jgi:class 3 adenylate cyclase/tetratricopeptide (TPR) repeat protein